MRSRTGGTPVLVDSCFSLRACTLRLLQRVRVPAGEVRAVHRRSFDARSGDWLFNFTTRRDRLHPLGILVADDVLAAAETGMRIRFEAETITAGSRRLRLGEVITDPLPPPASCPPDNLERLRRCLPQFGRVSPLLLAHEFPLAAGRLRLPLVARDHLPRFGAGEGLTPAFDDFFTGMLLADRRLRQGLVRLGPGFFAVVKPQTTLPSWWQLRFARRGRSALFLENFVAAFFSRPVKAAEILAVIGHGETSGSDFLFGIESYCTALAREVS